MGASSAGSYEVTPPGRSRAFDATHRADGSTERQQPTRQACGESDPMGDATHILTGLVELCDGLGSDQLFGCEVEAVGVALDRLEQPGCWIVELAQQGAGGDGRFIAGDDLLQRLGRRAG
jgi:hypothetical protein